MGAPRPNVLLLILDSTRARNTSLHGYHRETTPFLESFAESATTYTQARAPAGRSLPSHASIFTGYLPQEHGVNDLKTKLTAGTSVFESLANRGYATGLFTDNPYLTDLETGLDNGFEDVENNRDLFEEGVSPSAFVEEGGGGNRDFLVAALESDAPMKSVLNGLSWTLKWRFPRLAPEGAVFSSGFTYADRFDAWRDGVDDRPWAACINLMDTHVPFRPTAEYDRWQSEDGRAAYDRYGDEVGEEEAWKHALLEDRYDGTIRQADAVVETIVDSLRESGELDDTLVVVTSDHGEGFGEHSPIDDRPVVGHGDAVEDVLLHVPLVVRYPDQSDGRTVTNPVGLVDLPTVIDAVVDGDGGAGFDTDRIVLAGGFEDGRILDAAYAAAGRGVDQYVRRPDGAWTVHVPTSRTTYLRDDGVPEGVESTMDALEPAAVTTDAKGEVTASTKQQLEALGYTE